MVSKNISSLRELMKESSIDCTIIFTGDPHGSEYPHPQWNIRHWLTGFSGSVGTAVVTAKKALLFTDPMYKITAVEQLSGSEIELLLMRDRFASEYFDWICDNLPSGSVVAFDGQMLPEGPFRAFNAMASEKGLILNNNMCLPENFWPDRPAMEIKPVFSYDVEWSGRSVSEKVSDLREKMQASGADWHLVTRLDDVAWLYNFRGKDIPNTPVAYAYGLVGNSEVRLYIDSRKVDKTMREYFKVNGITIIEYSKIKNDLAALNNDRIYIDPAECNCALVSSFSPNCKIMRGNNLVTQMKVIKNSAEIENLKQVLVREGANSVKVQCWLDKALDREPVTELQMQNKIREFMSADKAFIDMSFETIVAYADHAAMPHYSPTDKTDRPFLREGAFLFDAGGQYFGGTTDMTRTIELGKVSDEFKKDYTMTLKGVIALSELIFPYGSCGAHLCAIALAPIWRGGFPYTGGLGHGVGNCLCDHENPPVFKYLTLEPTKLSPGMVIAIEPGVYKEGKFGIRIENMAVVTLHEETPDGKLLGFETLTSCPIDVRPLLPELMSAGELDWIKRYNNKAAHDLAPYLTAEEQKWMKDLTDLNVI